LPQLATIAASAAVLSSFANVPIMAAMIAQSG
jgi:hypothetical protein